MCFVTRGFMYSGIRLIVPPLPEASRPSKITAMRAPDAVTQSSMRTRSSWRRLIYASQTFPGPFDDMPASLLRWRRGRAVQHEVDDGVREALVHRVAGDEPAEHHRATQQVDHDPGVDFGADLAASFAAFDHGDQPPLTLGDEHRAHRVGKLFVPRHRVDQAREHARRRALVGL